jgi:hypothetical protein
MFAKIMGMYNNYWDDGEMQDPSEEIQLAAVKQNGHAIKDYKKPSVDVQVAAVKQNPNAIEHLVHWKQPIPEEVQLAAVTKDGYVIRELLEGSVPIPEKVLRAAVKQQPDVLILLNERHIYDY